MHHWDLDHRSRIRSFPLFAAGPSFSEDLDVARNPNPESPIRGKARKIESTDRRYEGK